MERTRSGRTVKRSSKFLEMEHEYEDGPAYRSEEEDDDDTINSEDESLGEENINYPEENTNKIAIRTRRTFPKGEAQELIWKDGKLVTVVCNAPPVIHVVEKLRPKPQTIYAVEDIPPPLKVVKDDPGTKFYSHVFEVLNRPNISPIKIIGSSGDSEGYNRSLPPLDLLNDDKFKMKLETKNTSLMPKGCGKVTTDKIKDVTGLGVNMEELERYSRVTGYILYNIVSKRKSESQVQDSQSYRKIQETWATMPDRNKRDWEIKAKQIKKQIDNKHRNEMIEDSSKKEKRRAALKKAEDNLRKARLDDHNMVDLASYLKTVGEGMSQLASQVASYQGPVAIAGVQSVLLDYLLCTMVPLIGIFEGSEGLDRHVTTDSLNKLTFLLPGLN